MDLMEAEVQCFFFFPYCLYDFSYRGVQPRDNLVSVRKDLGRAAGAQILGRCQASES